MGYETHNVAYTPDWYLAERITGSPAPNAEATTTGAIGLMYPSDYGYAAYGTNCDNKTSMTLNRYDQGCGYVDWLLLEGDDEWLISPYPDHSSGAFYVGGGFDGFVGYFGLASVSVRPVLYLEHDIKVISGSGSKNNPYILE